MNERLQQILRTFFILKFTGKQQRFVMIGNPQLPPPPPGFLLPCIGLGHEARVVHNMRTEKELLIQEPKALEVGPVQNAAV